MASSIEELLREQGLLPGQTVTVPPTKPSMDEPLLRELERLPKSIDDLLTEQGFDLDLVRQRRTDTLAEQRNRRMTVGTQAERVETLRGLGVDVETGGPASVRARLSVTPPERQAQVLQEAFPLGFSRTSAGIVINVADPSGTPRQVLLDEEGFSMADFADAAGEGIVVAGAVAGTVAALAAAPALLTGGVVSLALLAVISGVSGQTGLGVTEIISAYEAGGIDLNDPQDRQMLENIVKRRGVAAAVDSSLDFITAGTFRFGRGVAQKLVGPNAAVLAETPRAEIKAAAERLAVPLSPGELVGGGLLRAESIAEKVPGAAAPVKALRRAAQAGVTRVEEGLRGKRPVDVGPEIVAELETRRRSMVAAAGDLRSRAGAKIGQRLEEVRQKMSSKNISLDDAGEAVRLKIQSNLEKFKARQTAFEDALDKRLAKIPLEARAFLSSRGLKALAQKLEKEFPQRQVVEDVETGLLDELGAPVFQRTTGPETIPELFPSATRRMLRGIQKLPDTITVVEARNLRKTISSIIDNAAAFPGVSVGMLKGLEAELARTVRSGVRNAPTPEIGQALKQVLGHFKENVGVFRDQRVARTLLDPTQAGFLEGRSVLPELILDNNMIAAQRVIKAAGLNSTEVGITRRSVFDEMLRRAQDMLSGPKFIDPVVLAQQYDALLPATKTFLFGKDLRSVGTLIRLLAAKHGKVDISGIKAAAAERPILNLLKQAAKKERETQKLFETRVLKPFLNKEAGASGPSPEEFVRHVLRKNTTSEIKRLFRLLPKDKVNDFQAATTELILEKSGRAALGPETQAVALLAGRAPVGTKLAQIMEKDFGATVSESLEKIRGILPTDTIRILEDLALVQAGRGQAAAAGKAVGGLVGGSIISSFLNLQLGTAFRIIKGRIVSTMLTSKAVRAWMTSSIKFPPRRKDIAAFQLALPQIIEAVTESVGEASPEAQAMVEFFMDTVPNALGLLPEPAGDEVDVQDVTRVR